ncbi:MAG: YebC/PmpR family DNA-binding transcriptional regulator [Pseudomonadota bacterium]
MAGHSKWANIKHRKAAQDAKRGKVFTKLIREITISARLGGGVAADNPRLRAVIDKALSANMTRDTIDRAIKRGVGDEDSDRLEELTYEGYGAGGVAVFVEAMTDNKNRTVAEVRHAFTKYNGSLGTDGSVAYLFTKRGELHFPPDTNEDQLMEVALEIGAEDVQGSAEDGFLVITAWDEYLRVQDGLIVAGLKPEEAEITYAPAVRVELDIESGPLVYKLIERLEDLDDVQNVYSNADFSDELMQQMEEQGLI